MKSGVYITGYAAGTLRLLEMFPYHIHIRCLDTLMLGETAFTTCKLKFMAYPRHHRCIL